MPSGAGPARQIVVPGSISNLGPAFDALSVAVSVYLTVDIDDILPDSPGLLEMEFAGGPPGGENRIESGFRRAQATFGESPPGLRLRVRSDVPIRAGLGSSAAATVAGLRLYEAVTSPRATEDLLVIATEIEGHPDNAAAAMLGGLTLSCQRDDGGIIAAAWNWAAGLRFVVGTPGAELETAFARKVLPRELPMRDAVYNLQRALLFVHALATGRHDLLRESLRDRWHQPARQQYVPGLAEALAVDHPDVLGACLSGAGPSIAMIVGDGREHAAQEALAGIYTRLGLPYTIRTLSAHPPASPPPGMHS